MNRVWEVIIGALCIFFLLFAGLQFLSIRKIDVWHKSDYHECNAIETWPFKWKRSGKVYDLQLNYQFKQNSSPEYTILDQYVLQTGAQNKHLHFRDLVNISDDQWKLPIDQRVAMLYPQSINISEAINRLILGEPLNEKSINSPKFRYLTISNQVCNPDNKSSQDLDLIITVKSGIFEFDRRQEFRRLYSNLNILNGPRIGLVFSIGLPRQRRDNIFLRGDRLLHLDESGGEYLNPKDLEKAKENLKNETETHSDLILGDYEDTYFNLSLKTQYAFTWAATFCRKSRPIILFTDDDVPFYEKSILRALFALNSTERQDLFHGTPISRGQVFRLEDRGVEKWSLLKSEIPWPQYLPYLHGGFLLISFQNVERIALGMLFTQIFPIEDAYIGLTASRLGIEPKPIDEIMRRYKIFTRKAVYLDQLDKKFLKYH